MSVIDEFIFYYIDCAKTMRTEAARVSVLRTRVSVQGHGWMILIDFLNT